MDSVFDVTPLGLNILDDDRNRDTNTYCRDIFPDDVPFHPKDSVIGGTDRGVFIEIHLYVDEEV